MQEIFCKDPEVTTRYRKRCSKIGTWLGEQKMKGILQKSKI